MWSEMCSPTTVQLGYCDSDIIVCLLFWNMLIYYSRQGCKVSILAIDHSRSFGVGNEMVQVRILECFFFFSPSSFCLCKCGNGDGFVHFLRIVAKSPPAFPK